MYEITTVAASEQTTGKTFVRIFNEKLLNAPEGWRISKFMDDLDHRWACTLRTLGVALGRPDSEYRPPEVKEVCNGRTPYESK